MYHTVSLSSLSYCQHATPSYTPLLLPNSLAPALVQSHFFVKERNKNAQTYFYACATTIYCNLFRSWRSWLRAAYNCETYREDKHTHASCNRCTPHAPQLFFSIWWLMPFTFHHLPESSIELLFSPPLLFLSVSLPPFDSGNTHAHRSKLNCSGKKHMLYTHPANTHAHHLWTNHNSTVVQIKKKKKEKRREVKNVIKFTSWEHKTLSSRQLRDWAIPC